MSNTVHTTLFLKKISWKQRHYNDLMKYDVNESKFQFFPHCDFHTDDFGYKTVKVGNTDSQMKITFRVHNNEPT